MVSELNLDMRSDGYVRVRDLLNLNLQTFTKIPLKSHTVEEIRETVRLDNKQRFSLLEEDGELLIRANQGHTVTICSLPEITCTNVLRFYNYSSFYLVLDRYVLNIVVTAGRSEFRHVKRALILAYVVI